MIIVITPEQTNVNEAKVINELFQEGLDLLHIRKPFINNEEMKTFLTQIKPSYHSQLVLHSHYELGKEYGISRFHIREKDRLEGLVNEFNGWILSTSVHDIMKYNELGKEWEYAFISPVFPSISKKGYGENTTILGEIKHRNNANVKLIALGGIHENNICEVLKSEVDGVALLGAIWESVESLKIFKKCRQIALS